MVSLGFRNGQKFAALTLVLVLSLRLSTLHAFLTPSAWTKSYDFRASNSPLWVNKNRNAPSFETETEVAGVSKNAIREEREKDRLESEQLLSVSPIQRQLNMLAVSSTIGIFTGINIVVFKRSIEAMRELCYGDTLVANNLPVFLIPVLGGISVGLIRFGGSLPPGLRQTVTEVDREAMASVSPIIERNRSPLEQLVQNLRKAIAAATTLGSGNSLGPEGPSVEAGMAVARFFANLGSEQMFQLERDGKGRAEKSYTLSTTATERPEVWSEIMDSPTMHDAIKRRRLLLSCGAAAGVSAGFNAPLAGTFFALEVVQRALLSATEEDEDTPGSTTQDSLTVDSISISAILLSSVISALVTKALLGNEEALRVTSFALTNPLVELPLYLMLGVLAGVLAAMFSAVAKLTKSFFSGELGPPQVQEFLTITPKWFKPIIGSLFCGFMGVIYPQTLFFGYETLNSLLASTTFPADEAITLLSAKFATTAVAAASGLVGGTFAPSIFLGGMLGAAFHDVVDGIGKALLLEYPQISPILFDVSGLQAYAMVGGASVLAALFRAPLTASLLLFECTKNYDVILPLMASAGVGSLVGDIVEQALEEQRRDLDNVSWGDLAMSRDQASTDESTQT